jgi:hypothetical protein
LLLQTPFFMMKNTLLLLLWLVAFGARAQPLFTACDSIDANRINALATVHGDLWWDPFTYKAHCRFPVGAKTNINYAGALWMSAFDDAGQLHVAAQTYRQDGNDYWPGPLDGAGAITYPESEKWAKIWKVRRSEVDEYLATPFHNVTNTPPSILTWPAKGNIHARGKDGVPLTIADDMAPFVDVNGDGLYQPIKGDYPDFPGEQALWWVFNDNGPTHTETNGTPLKVEVHAMAYAFKRNTLIDYVVYYDYTMVNRSGHNYRDMRMALWNDADMGYRDDDFVAYDSLRRLGIVYNGKNQDGFGHWDAYGYNPPAVGLTIVHMPGDVPGNYAPVGVLGYRYKYFIPPGSTPADVAFSNHMRGVRWSGESYGPFPDGFDECRNNMNPGERTVLLATNDFLLPAGGRQKVVMALVVDSAAKGCPVFDITGIQRVADTAWQLYHTQVGVPAVARGLAGLQVYPNPAQGVLHIAGMMGGTTHVTVYNVLGQPMGPTVAVMGAEATIAVGHLPAGTYMVTASGVQGMARAVFVKE